MKHQIEKDAAEIMMILIIYRDDFQGRPRNRETICEWTCIDTDRVTDASVYLCSNGFASMRGSIIEPTDDGLQWLRGISSNPFFDISISAWKEEVLTGITTGGNRTKIENAALPLATIHAANHDFEERCIDAMAAIMASNDAGLRILEVKELQSQGKLGWCRGVGRKSHLWEKNWNRSLCRECFNKKRKSNEKDV